MWWDVGLCGHSDSTPGRCCSSRGRQMSSTRWRVPSCLMTASGCLEGFSIQKRSGNRAKPKSWNILLERSPEWKNPGPLISGAVEKRNLLFLWHCMSLTQVLHPGVFICQRSAIHYWLHFRCFWSLVLHFVLAFSEFRMTLAAEVFYGKLSIKHSFGHGRRWRLFQIRGGT